MNAQRAAELQAFRRGLGSGESGALDALRAAARAALAAGNSAQSVLESARLAVTAGESTLRRHLEMIPALSIACRGGCHWCCHLKVSVTAPEVFLIAHYLQHEAPAAWRAAVQARAALLAQDPRIFSSDAKAEAHLPCAMLTEQGACGVYPARPLICRGYTAPDPEPCRQMLDDDSVPVAVNEALAREHAALGMGLGEALESAGLPSELLELTAGVNIALSEPNALQRWLDGEPLFATARADREEFFVDGEREAADCESTMTEYVVTKQGATSDWGSNAEGEVQEMPLSKPDGSGWTLHSVIPSQYNVMAVWQREEGKSKKR